MSNHHEDTYPEGPTFRLGAPITAAHYRYLASEVYEAAQVADVLAHGAGLDLPWTRSWRNERFRSRKGRGLGGGGAGSHRVRVVRSADA
jgi:hypothetical protein